MYIKILKLNLKNGSNVLKDYDLDTKTKRIAGISFKTSQVASGDKVTMKIKSETIIDDLTADIFTCNASYIAPNERFFTLFPKVENIQNHKLNIEYKQNGAIEDKEIDLILLLEEDENYKNSIKR